MFPTLFLLLALLIAGLIVASRRVEPARMANWAELAKRLGLRYERE